MKSHEYQVSLRDWSRALLPTALVVAGLCGLLIAGESLGLLPRPKLNSNPIRFGVALAHQSRSARTRSAAEIVLLGDSTCWMGPDALELPNHLPGHPEVINLGLVLGLRFDIYGEVLSDFVAANPGQVRAVVVLITPFKLSAPPVEDFADYWRQIRLAEHGPRSALLPQPPASQGEGREPEGRGVDAILKQHFFSHLLASPLRGTGGPRYGFSSGIDDYMTAHHGSLLAIGNVKPLRKMRSWNMQLDPALESECRALRAKVPPGAKLILGFTPIPESYSSPAERQQRKEMLAQWQSWMQADALLTNSPPTLPDVFFADSQHVNEAGQKEFTRMLGKQLASLLGGNGLTGSSPTAQAPDPQLPGEDPNGGKGR